tara:strand:+ start:984 stop:1163 length:180 start_codon:yes stop_codon:yes gene_type:complete
MEKGFVILTESELNDTINCWVATRINGASASIGCYGNINMQLLKMLDEKITLTNVRNSN